MSTPDDRVYCGRCGRSGHTERPSLDPRLPLVVCGKSLVPTTRDPAAAMVIRDRREAEAAARKAARDAKLSGELRAAYMDATD